MLLGNYQLLNKVPGREFGGTTNVASMWKESFREAIYLSESSITDESNKASLPNGTVPPYSWLLAPKAGGLASINEINGTGALSINSLSLGKALESAIAGVGTISDASMSLVTSMAATIAGSGTLSASMVGVVNMACTLAGTGNLTAAMGALAFCVATITGSGTISANLKGKLFMAANIYVNEGAATVDQIVDGVVDGIGSVTATIPELLDTDTGSIIIPLD